METNPLEGAEAWCAVEGTDVSVRYAGFCAWLNEGDNAYRKLQRKGLINFNTIAKSRYPYKHEATNA